MTRAPRGGGAVVAAVGLGVAIAPLDSAVNVAFPAITAEFGRPLSDIRWIVIGYVLAYGSLLLGFGRVADLFGHRRVFLAGLAASVVAMSLCALAPGFHALVAARVLQGVATALVLATGPALVTLSLPPERRSHGVARYMLAFSLAYASGPVLAGPLVQTFGWSAVWWFRVPVALVAIALTLALVPAPPARAPGARFDPLAGATLALGLATSLLAISQAPHFGWTAPATLALAAAGIALLAVFARVQDAAARRILDLSLFARRAFAAANAAHVLVNAASFTVMLLVPYYLAHSLAADAWLAGPMLASSPLGFVLASPVAGRMLERGRGRAAALAGLVLSGLGLVAIGAWPAQAPWALVPCVLLAQGFGYGLFQVALLDLVMGALPRADQGVAGSLNMLTRNLGVVLGSSAGTLLFQAAGSAAGAAGFMPAFRVAFWSAAAVTALAGVALAASRERGDG